MKDGNKFCFDRKINVLAKNVYQNIGLVLVLGTSRQVKRADW